MYLETHKALPVVPVSAGNNGKIPFAKAEIEKHDKVNKQAKALGVHHRSHGRANSRSNVHKTRTATTKEMEVLQLAGLDGFFSKLNKARKRLHNAITPKFIRKIETKVQNSAFLPMVAAFIPVVGTAAAFAIKSAQMLEAKRKLDTYAGKMKNASAQSKLDALAAAGVSQADFDGAKYLAMYPDVAADKNYAANPWAHYIDFGMNEGRMFTPTDAAQARMAAASQAPQIAPSTIAAPPVNDASGYLPPPSAIAQTIAPATAQPQTYNPYSYGVPQTGAQVLPSNFADDQSQVAQPSDSALPDQVQYDENGSPIAPPPAAPVAKKTSILPWLMAGAALYTAVK